MRESSTNGIVLASVAVLIWSTSGAAMYFVGQQLGVWQLMTIICAVGAAAQVSVYAARGRRIRDVLLPPLLWLPVIGGFVVTELAYSTAVTSAAHTQVVGVNLVNYFWPTLTVAMAVVLVPGTRAGLKLLVAVALTLTGLAIGNWNAIVQWLAGDGENLSPLPYVLAAVGATAWAAYSALLSRWKNWARDHATAPAGFVVVCLVCLTVCLARGDWRPVPWSLWPALVLSGLGPQAAGYMCWELALHRVSPMLLGLMASAIPLMSTMWLLLLQASAVVRVPEQPGAVPRLVLAGALVASAVAIKQPDQKEGPLIL